MRVLILGANGQPARHTAAMFLHATDAVLTLYLRRATGLKNSGGARTRIVEGDVLDVPALTAAMKDQDVVYANLAGESYRSVLDPYRDSAAVIESSPIDSAVMALTV